MLCPRAFVLAEGFVAWERRVRRIMSFSESERKIFLGFEFSFPIFPFWWSDLQWDVVT